MRNALMTDRACQCYVFDPQNFRASIQHLETRKPKSKGAHLEFFVHFEGTREDVGNVVKTLRQSSAVHDVRILSETDAKDNGKGRKGDQNAPC